MQSGPKSFTSIFANGGLISLSPYRLCDAIAIHFHSGRGSPAICGRREQMVCITGTTPAKLCARLAGEPRLRLERDAVQGRKICRTHKTMNCSKLSRLLLLPAMLCAVATNQLQAADAHWILRGDAGPSFVNNISTTTTDFLTGIQTTTRLAFKTGVRLDLETGYQFNDSWTLEAELGYIYNPVDLSNSTGTTSPSFYQVPALVNCIYTLPIKCPVKPYLGAGLGVVFSGLNNVHDFNGAGQLLAGVKYELSDRVDLGLGYKLLVTTEHNWNDVLDSTSGGRTIAQAITAAVTVKF
jgi:opacity protein-like surface antigen